MIRILYRSIATFPDAEALELGVLKESLIFNAAHRITGYLWRAEAQFIQALHGPEGAVRALVKRIAADRRHHSFDVMLDTKADGTSPFEGWSMGYRKIGTHGLRLGRAVDGQRAPVSAAQAEQIWADMVADARDTAQHGSDNPHVRRPGEDEADYIARLGAMV